MKAIVYKSTGSWYIVTTEEGNVVNARIKGVMKIDGITSTNPIAVGDVVDIVMEDDADGTAMIVNIYDRKNYVARQSPHNKHQHHIVASNLDQSLLFATLKDPKTSTGFIDRFLVACEMYHVPAIIVFNKADTYGQKEMDRFAELKKIYGEIGYTVILSSMQNGTGIDEIRQLLKDKTTLLSGHSGVGKSTFINVLFPELDLPTNEVSEWSGKGLHTTTFAEMYNIASGSNIIDTPGIRELGIVGISKQELSGYYPEMRALAGQCKFNNCLHIDEPGCIIKKSVEEGIISGERFINYYKILETIVEAKY
jgi:ribosome biogenesis GTPase